MWFLVLIGLMGVNVVTAVQVCSHFDFSQQAKDTDGVPLCPAISGTNPWEYMDCAFQQAKAFHPPTAQELSYLETTLLSLSEKNVSQAMKAAAYLGLQTCRNKNAGDSYVVMTTIPGLKTYVGPFITYREKNASEVVIQDGHVQDCNWGGYPQELFLNTHAILAITNGYPRALSGSKVKTCWGASYESDGTHNENNLFYRANLMAAQLWPTSVFFQLHGMKNRGTMITNSLSWDVGPNSLLYAFAAELKKVLQGSIDKDPSYLAALGVCGKTKTPLTNIVCDLTATWIEGRYMDGSKDPVCANGNDNTNRWIGLEEGPEILDHPEIMTAVLRALEENYLKGQKIN